MSPISTHTPLTGRDDFDYWYRTGFPDFYSHAPYGTWLNPVFENATGRNFYSHAPYGTWQFFVTLTFDRSNFYSHAPYGTWRGYYMFIDLEFNFYSHAPYGTWRYSPSFSTHCSRFLLTRPLRDVTSANHPYIQLCSISTHTPLTGRDMRMAKPLREQVNFYSHAPYGTWPYIL